MSFGRKTAARVLGLACAAVGASLLSTPAQAFFGSHASGPKACAPYSDRFDVPGLWLGHFSGGRRAHHANGDLRVDWRSEYQCFFTAHACRAWRADMKRAYRHYEGHGTCLPLRGGGKRVVHVVRGIKARY